MKKCAIIDKQPSRNDYSKYFDFPFEVFHMSSVPIPKLLKKDVDLVINTDDYDYLVLVGSEAAKEYAGVTSVTNFQGTLVNNKFLPISNPAANIFKPEGKPAFEAAVKKIHNYISGELTNSVNTGDFRGIQSTDEILAFLKEVLASNAPIVAIDCETTALYPRDGFVLGISLSYKENHGLYLDCNFMDDECTDMLQSILDTYPMLMHNCKFDVKWIEYHLGVTFNRSKIHDTMLLHYVLDENGEHGLKPLALKHTNFADYDKELDEFKVQYCKDHKILKGDFTYDLIPFDVISKYAGIDTAATLTIFNKFYPIVQANAKLLWVYENLLINGTFFLMDMEEVGIPIDANRMKLAEDYLDREIEEAKLKIYDFPSVTQFEKDNDKIFNPGSVQQLRKVLFDYEGLEPSGKKTATGAISTDAEVLEGLDAPLPNAILKVRKLTKIKNTYISKILPELDRDSRIRTNFNLIFTVSGRLSSSGKFNAQQIPRDDSLVKACIKAPDGYSIVSADLVTAEMFVAAVLSKDLELQKVFISKGDFHSTIAKAVFNLPCAVEDVKKLYPGKRQAAKAISFGILFGSGPQKVSETVTKETGEYYPISQAKEDINDYFTKFSKLKKWLNDRKDEVEANGFMYTHFGRKRRVPNVFSHDKGIASHEVRSAINSLIQGTSSDINLLGALETANELKANKIDAHIFALVHDSVVAIVKDECIEEYKEILIRNIQKDRGCSIPGCPIGMDVDVGKDYSFGKFEKQYELVEGKLCKLPPKDGSK